MGASALTDYGATFMLKKVFDAASLTAPQIAAGDSFRLVLFTSGTVGTGGVTHNNVTPAYVSGDQAPIFNEVSLTATGAGYARKTLGPNGHVIEYQTAAGVVSVVETGIATVAVTADSANAPLSFVFTGPLTSPETSITGYAVLIPGAGLGTAAILNTDIMFAQEFDNPFTPRNPDDTLTISKINFRLSEGLSW